MKHIVCACFILISSGAVFAQNLDVLEQAGRIDRARSDRLRAADEKILTQVKQPPSGKMPVAPVAKETTRGETCIHVHSISVKGAHIIPASEVQKETARWQDKCVGLSEINSLLEALTFLYVKRGYVASRAYISPQNIKDGSLDVSVIEGTLDSITLDGQSTVDKRIAAAFPNITNKPVNLRDIEQGVDQINRLRSSKATIQLKSGAKTGDSILDVAIKNGRPWYVSTSFDTLGSVATGLYQAGINVGYENLLGLNDSWNLNYQRSMNKNPIYFNEDRPNSNSVTAAVSVPFGSYTFGVNGAWSDYHSLVNGTFAPMKSSGGSRSVAPYITRVLHRDQISKTWLTGRLTWKQTENFLLGTKIDVSSRTLAIVTIEAGHSRQLAGGQLSASFGYHRGLDAFGALDDGASLEGMPKAQFQKYTAAVSYERAQEIGALSLIGSSSLSGQWADDRLFGSEQMSLGGYGSVRGTQEAVLYADKAILMRNELSLLLPEIKQLPAIGRLEPYIALDLGRSFVGTHANGLTGNLVGGAVGLRNRYGNINFDISYSDLLSKPDFVNNSGLVQSRVSVEF